MSYEHCHTDKKPCPCGKGHIIVRSEANEWNQFKEYCYVDCPVCSERYHPENVFICKSGQCVGRYVLVPKGETLASELPSINIYTTPIPEQLCYQYTYREIEDILAILSRATNCSSIKDRNARRVVSICRNSSGSAKIGAVRAAAAEALLIYKDLPLNYEKDQERLSVVKSHIIEI